MAFLLMSLNLYRHEICTNNYTYCRFPTPLYLSLSYKHNFLSLARISFLVLSPQILAYSSPFVIDQASQAFAITDRRRLNIKFPLIFLTRDYFKNVRNNLYLLKLLLF